MDVGERVAQLRASVGDSLREASARTGVSHATIARIEKGNVTRSSHATLRKLAEGYGVSYDYLVNGTESPADLPSVIRTQLPVASSERVSAYVRLLVKAMEAGVEPQILDTALDLILMKHETVPLLRLA